MSPRVRPANAVSHAKRPSDAECWEAVLRKDGRHDARFLFGVVTTGVYCRPSCSARRPLRKNVRFYVTPEEAERGGLRPCRRCRPRDEGGHPQTARMRALCEHIRQQSDSGEALTLSALGRRAAMSPSHLQRSFRAVVGLTPRQYVEACRLETLKGQLRASSSATRAIYDAGFGSSSRVYERVQSRLGMTPGEYRAGGKDLAISYATVDSPLGLLLMGATDRGLCFVQFGRSCRALVEELRREYPKATIQPMKTPHAPRFRGWTKALRQHLRDGRPLQALPIAVRVSAFRFKVWRFLQSIPYGQVRSYAQVARAVGQPAAARAVAGACAANPVALVVPCHRVIRADGDVGGYRWGRERKQQLIDRERSTRARP